MYDFINLVNANWERRRWAEEEAAKDAEKENERRAEARKHHRMDRYCFYGKVCYVCAGGAAVLAGLAAAKGLGGCTLTAAGFAAAMIHTAGRLEQ